MNFLRIWGGSIWPQDAFFDACDELGIMLQQDGIFSDAFYPTDDVFQRNLAAEVTHQVRRLSAHPSIVMYVKELSVTQHHITPCKHPLYTFIAVHTPVYTR